MSDIGKALHARGARPLHRTVGGGDEARGEAHGEPARGVRRWLSSVVLTLAVAAVVAIAGAGRTGAQQEGAQPDGAQRALGQFLYGRDCAGCHGPNGEGSWRGTPLRGVGAASAHYFLASGRMPIRSPDDKIDRTEPRYDDEALAALVAYVAGFGDGPDVPEVLPGGDVAEGGRLYRLHCAACHSSTGIGGALAFGQFAPPVLGVEQTVVAAAIVVGPRAMPSFATERFTPAEIDAIVAYTQFLDDPVDHGGVPLGRTGRVDEGLVALVVALPLLLLAAAWIGRRR